MKIISVPLSDDALHRLGCNESESGDLNEIELDDAQFQLLWQSGLFDEFNDKLGVLIDDYEDESVTDIEKLKEAFCIANAYRGIHSGESVFQTISELVSVAIEKRTGIFFYF